MLVRRSVKSHKPVVRSFLRLTLILALLLSLTAPFAPPALAAPAPAPADNWEALADQGLNNEVRAFAVLGTDLYVGGWFTASFGGATTLSYVARYDTTTGTWHPLADNGLDNLVFALFLDGTDLYVGGDFTQTAGGGTTGLNNIARYDTVTETWHALTDNGLNDRVYDFAISGSDLYVGGQFTETDGGATTDIGNIVRYDTLTNTWNTLANDGLNSTLQALEIIGSDLFVGGGFTETGDGTLTTLNRIARYDTVGGSWHALADNGLDSPVSALASIGTDLYVGGHFTETAGGATSDLNKVAKYDTNTETWEAFSDKGVTSFGQVNTLAVDGTTLYVGGFYFGTAGGAVSNLNHIAGYETTSGEWQRFADQGTNGSMNALIVTGNTLYLGGNISQSRNGAVTGLNGIAAYGLQAVQESSSLSSSSTVNNQGQKLAIDVASTGTTTLQLGRLIVNVPAFAIPAGETNCQVVAKVQGSSADYGFSLDDTVYDIKIVCDSGEVSILFAPITVCIRPKDGDPANKQVFHRHGAGSFAALPSSDARAAYACGTTQLLSLFTLGQFGLPATGFVPGSETMLSAQPASRAYSATDLTLNIPELGLSLPIVGVPQSPDGWDVSWLGDSAGYLYGTAFPTLAGNTVLTAHVWNADNSPGPFAHLDELSYGDQFSISAWGSTYTYEVHSNALYAPSSLRPLAHHDYDWVTLITCQYYDEATGEYSFRRAVRAVLVAVE